MEKVINILTTHSYSINLKNDFKNKEKINAYYPNFTNMRLLDRILLSIQNNTCGSIILSGAYGAGKSYFSSVLLNILYKNYNLKEYEELIKKAKSVYNIEETLKLFENKKYLVVFIDDSVNSFSEAVFIGVKKALKENNINVKLDSKIDIIFNKLEFWKKNYKEIYEKFKEKLEKNNFFKELEFRTDKVEKIFTKVYSEIFAGERFSFDENIKDIKFLLEDLENNILKEGYDGIFYVFDEFGRYLETNIHNIDVKEIQDMAEYCNLENKSNLLMIMHKDLFQYARKIKKDSERDEWEKVSGRFKKEHLMFEKNSVLEIIKKIIKKKNYEEYRKENLEIFKRKEKLLEKILNLDSEKAKKLTKEYYPLDYLSAIILPDLSQKLAQNERTLFAFICSEEIKAMKDIIKNNNDKFITIDYLYDYFENELKQLPVDSVEYKNYLISKDIIAKLPKNESELIKLVKSIAIIYIYNDFSEISPTYEILKYISNKENLDLSYLENNNYIMLQKYQESYKLLENIDFEIEKIIEEYKNKKLGKFDYIVRLEKEIKLESYYPLKYNDINKINRYLGQYFVDVSELMRLDELKKNIKEDGRIIYLTNIENNQNYLEISERIYSTQEDIVIIGKNDHLDIYEELKELEVIELLKKERDEFKNNETLKIELYLHQLEIQRIIKNKLEQFFDKKIDLIDLTYNFLEKKYPKYVGLNYELINKRTISSPMRKARNEILSKLNNRIELTNDYFMSTKAEASVARIVLKNTGIYEKDENNESYIKIKNLMSDVLETIKEKTINCYELYTKYCSNMGEYGIREGIFTFLLGLIAIEEKDNLVFSISEGQSEIEFEVDVLDLIEKNPEKYQVSYLKIKDSEIKYMEELEKIIKKYIIVSDSKIYVRILNGIKELLLNNPRYVANMYLPKFKGLNKIFRSIFTINNAKEFVLKGLLEIYKENDYKEVILKFEEEVIGLEEEKKEFISILEKETMDILSNGKTLLDYISKLNPENEIEEYLFSLKSKSLDEILIDITRKIKGFSYENWRNETDLEEYKKLLSEKVKEKSEVKIELENVKNYIKIEKNNIEDIIEIDSELDMMEKMLMSKVQSVLKNMGMSLTENQKKKVIAKILSEI